MTRAATAGFRCSTDELETIKTHAEAYGLSMSAYVLAAALQDLPDEQKEAANRFKSIEGRLARLEGFAFGD